MQLATQPQNKPTPIVAAPTITSGKKESPYRILVFGPEKVGKSTFAAGAPDAIHIDTEHGTDEIDVKNRVEVTTWKELLDTLQWLCESQHSYRTLVLDSVTSVERMATAEVLRVTGKPSLTDIGSHGAGYSKMYALFDSMMVFVNRLFEEKRMHVVCVAHSKIETFKNPEGDDFDRYNIDLSRYIGGSLKKWATAILFARFETLVDTTNAKERHGKGVGGRARKLMCLGCDAFEAGNRHSLPESLELSWEAFQSAASDGSKKEERILGEIREAMASLPEDKQQLAEKSIAACKGDAAKLSQTLNWVRNQQEK